MEFLIRDNSHTGKRAEIVVKIRVQYLGLARPREIYLVQVKSGKQLACCGCGLKKTISLGEKITISVYVRIIRELPVTQSCEDV